MASTSGSLFAPDVPSGFQYRNDFVTAAEERRLTDEIRNVEFSTFEMRGVVARRRVAFFGRTYDAGDAATRPVPAFLLPLRDRIAEWSHVEAEAFEMALINEYPPGAPIGWHRDAPQYDIVAGVSLLSACRMKFRPYVRPAGARGPGATPPKEQASTSGRRVATHEIMLERRSAYLMAGEARNEYEHHIPPLATLRYSITFRTVRA